MGRLLFFQLVQVVLVPVGAAEVVGYVWPGENDGIHPRDPSSGRKYLH